jgi:hypothetical protein
MILDAPVDDLPVVPASDRFRQVASVSAELWDGHI